MKTPATTSRNVVLLAVLAGLALPLHAQQQQQQQHQQPAAGTASAPKIQVAVDLPVGWRPSLYYDELAETFGYYVRSVFQERGYSGEIEYVDGDRARPEDAVRLRLRVFDWRLNRVGNIDCTFSATLETPRGSSNLGVFSDTSLYSITRGGSIWLGDSFEDAARGAIRDLFTAVARAELIPGLRQAS